MKALILVGGFGTRLRPLTLSTPKPLIPFANIPMLARQIEALKMAGVNTIILAVNYRPEVMEAQTRHFEETYKVKIIFSVENEPLGTAGPLAHASKLLREGGEMPFFVLNSDVICKFPLKEMLAFHKSHDGVGTIAAVAVEHPQNYGVMVVDKESYKISSFVEKPTEFISNKINAGIYVLDQKVLDIIKLKKSSIEIDVFPKLVSSDGLYCFNMSGFWMDVGKPFDYLAGTKLYLEYISGHQSKAIEPGTNIEILSTRSDIIGNVLIHPTASIGKDCLIGPDVVIGPNVRIGDGVRLSNTVVLNNAFIDSSTFIKSTIVGWNCKVGKWAHVDRMTVLGEDVSLDNCLYVSGGIVLPNKSVAHDILTPTIVM